MATRNRLRHKKKKKKATDKYLLCAIQKEKGDICSFYYCSYFFLIGNDLGVMGVFFPENCDKSEEVGAEISDSLKFSILVFISVGKIQHLTF